MGKPVESLSFDLEALDRKVERWESGLLKNFDMEVKDTK